MFCDSDVQHMQCHGWSTAIRFFQLSAFRSTFTPRPARNVSSFIFPARPASQSRCFASIALANAPAQAVKHSETETPPKPSSAALARAASQTIRMCAKEKQFGDALYVLNSMRFSIYPKNFDSAPPPSERAASIQDPERKRSQLLSSTPSSINGYTFINFGQPVPTRLASHSFLHSLVKAGLPTKAAAQAELMMADGIRIRTKTMESILASTVDRSSYPPVQSLKASREGARLSVRSKYPITDTHTSIAVHLLEEARHRRQERTQRMYDVVINACLIQGEIIVASLLFLILLKDWQLRLKKQPPNNTSPEPPEPRFPSQPRPSSLFHGPLLDRIDYTLTTRRDPRDPQFQNALEALANLAFAMDTGQYPPKLIGRLIKALYSVPKSDAVVYVGSPPGGSPVNAYKYFHRVLMRLVVDAGPRRDEQKVRETGRQFDADALHALLRYCLHYRMSKALASDILEVLKRKKKSINVPVVNVLFRGSTMLRDDTIRMDRASSANTFDSIPVALSRRPAALPLTRWAHTVNVLKLEHALQYPSEPVIYTPLTPDSHTVINLITHLTATGRGSIVANKLYDIIPELSPVYRNNLRITVEESDRCLASYGPYFLAAVLNALVKNGRTRYAERVWQLAIVAEKASWRSGTEPWFLPIEAYTCMLQLYSKEMRVWKAKTSSGGTIGKGSIPPTVKGKSVFRTVQIRCRFSETMEESDAIGRMPLRMRKFVPDERYFNALLELYARRALGYARPMKNCNSYWRWIERLASDRFAKNGVTSVHWHPMLAEIVAEMGKYGYKVPPAIKFLLVGRISGTERAGPPPAQEARPISRRPRQNPQFIPVLKTRGLPVSRGKSSNRLRRDMRLKRSTYRI